MAHYVNCTICGERFDRDKEAYVLTGTRRYAQAACYLREKEKNPDYKKYEIIDPTAIVKCKFCKKDFDKTKEPFKLFSNGEYSHESCFQLEEQRPLTDAEQLDRYIMKLFGTDYVKPRIRKQINTFIENYGFSYSGIHKTLIYFYEIKHGDISKANEGIGIVEYVYGDAEKYYYMLWEAEQRNKNKDITQYKPVITEITIKPPKANIKKRKLFSFLD